MLTPKENLLNTLKRCNRVIHAEIKDITHFESLIQPPYKGNCLNWVLGHIVNGRDDCLHMMHLPLNLSDAERVVYVRESQPLTDPQKAIKLNALVEKLDLSFEQLTAAITALSEEGMAADAYFVGPDPQPLFNLLVFLQWHETYHIGQLDLLRQVAGKNDSII